MKEVHNPPISLFRPYVPDVAAFMQQNIKTGESVICVGKISHSGTSVNLPQFEYLKTLLPKEQWGDIKMTLPAPEWYHLRYKQGEAYSKDAYTNDADYFHDIAVAYRKELDILYKAGLRNVQIDDPIFACETFIPYGVSPKQQLIKCHRFLLPANARRLERGQVEHMHHRRAPRHLH